MGNKVDMREVSRFSEDLANISSNITEVLERINSDIDKITKMDSFRGEQLLMQKVILPMYMD